MVPRGHGAVSLEAIAAALEGVPSLGVLRAELRRAARPERGRGWSDGGCPEWSLAPAGAVGGEAGLEAVEEGLKAEHEGVVGRFGVLRGGRGAEAFA